LRSEFLYWWGNQLLDLVPEQLRRAAMEAEAVIADASTPGVLVLRRRRRGVEQFLGQMRLDDPVSATIRAVLNGRSHGEQVFLRLPETVVLERNLVLPLAAERDPQQVLAYEMERLTPFSADEVFWGFTIEARDRARSRLVLQLTLIPRSAVAALIELLTELGGRPNLLEVATPGRIPSIRLSHEPAPAALIPLSAKTLAYAAALLAALVLLSPYVRQTLEMADLKHTLSSMSQQVTQAETLQQEISGAGAAHDAVAAEKTRLGDTLEALAVITEILPDDSYLTEFTMRERKITLTGFSASAPKLITRLSADTRIRKPAFIAPVMKNESNHLDVFSIRAELAN